MLINGGLTDSYAKGNLLEGDTVAEMLHNDVAADGRLQQLYPLGQGFQFFFDLEAPCPPEGEVPRLVNVKQVEVFHPLLNLSIANHVHASVSYACKQISLGSVFPKITTTIEELGKDVVHYILAFRIVVQKYGGQPIHLTVMPLEQSTKFPFICHTLKIHTKVGFLNQKR